MTPELEEIARRLTQKRLHNLKCHLESLVAEQRDAVDEITGLAVKLVSLRAEVIHTKRDIASCLSLLSRTPSPQSFSPE